jgi:hypothetical protein
MSLAIGARLGPYEILSALGAGGSASARLESCELRRDRAVAQPKVTS